ncbi:MAG: mercuric reductase [Acidobacteria bacterium]|nr:mercuric reductase [Acidobacteriota bacterium]
MKFDAIVIGSGQAGNPLCHRFADLGWSVALIEKAHLGGTCINYGCTPTKTMVASAQVAHYARHAARWGVRTGTVEVDLAQIVARKNKVVQSFRGGQESRVAARPTLKLFRGTARFTGPRGIRVGDETLESERIFINTGTRAAVPKIAGIETSGYLTNATIMELETLPKHLIVLGGGYIGLEFGQMFRRFGSDVTVVHHSGQILPREDADVVAELQKALVGEGIRFLLNVKPVRASRQDGKVVLTLAGTDGETSIEGTHLLVATGRTPNTEELDLAKAGVETDKSGYVKVNNRLETNVPGVWALGDVKGGPAFTHISYNDYQIIYANLVDGKEVRTDERIVPYSVFTDPQLGGVGMTEKEARAQGHRLKIGRYPLAQVARAIERDETAGLMKIIVDAATDKILGASILSLEGGELVQILHAMMLADAPYTLLKGAIYIHPTLAEGFWGLMEEVKAAE